VNGVPGVNRDQNRTLGKGVGPRALTVGPTRLRARWLLIATGAVIVALIAGIAFGPVSLPPGAVAVELVDRIPGVAVHSGLEERQAAIIWELRLPRVVLGLLVGAMLALAGGCYQGVFRNPLADPYLLGVAAGAGLGTTVAIVLRGGNDMSISSVFLPLAAFVGALVGVGMTYLLGASSGGHRSTATLILAGVAVASFLTAVQTYLQQRHVDTLREVYSWMLGRLSVAGWREVLLLLPYVAFSAIVILLHRRTLDVMSVGDEEAGSLGLHPERVRYLLLVVCSLGTAAAVAVSGLIGFVGIIVPHTIRLLVGHSYRVILPLCALFGAAFLVLADLAARVVLAPAELPIGVVTAFLGAPFFVLVMRTAKRISV